MLSFSVSRRTAEESTQWSWRNHSWSAAAADEKSHNPLSSKAILRYTSLGVGAHRLPLRKNNEHSWSTWAPFQWTRCSTSRYRGWSGVVFEALILDKVPKPRGKLARMKGVKPKIHTLQ